MASDALKNLMSFSTIRFEERQCQGVPRGNAWARFLGSFFAAWQRMNIKNQTDQRAKLSMGRILQSKILRARVNQTFPQAQHKIARAIVCRSKQQKILCPTLACTNNPTRQPRVGRQGGSQGERLGSFSFALSLWNDKERASIANRERAKLSMGRILQSKILRARVNQTFPQAQHDIARASVRRRRKAKNLAKEILSFAEEKNADMIAVMTKQETAVANILLGSYTHQIIMNSKIPVLTMKPLEINTLDQEYSGT
jgi:hypothetical protein